MRTGNRKKSNNKKKKTTSATRELIWQVYVHRLRTWAPPSNVKIKDIETKFVPCRPYLILVINTNDGSFLTSAEEEEESGLNIKRGPEKPTNAYICDYIKKILDSPRILNDKGEEEEDFDADAEKKKKIEKSIEKPKMIVFADTKTARNQDINDEDSCSYVKGCREQLKKIGIKTGFRSVPEEVIEAVIREQIESNMNEAQESWGVEHLPGLMESVDGFTAQFGTNLFTAAASYFNDRALFDLSKIDTNSTNYKGRYFVVEYLLPIDANNHAKLRACCHVDQETLALTIYKNEEDAKRTAEEMEKDGDDVASSMKQKSMQVCIFQGEHQVPFEDLDSKEKFDWPCALAVDANLGELKVGDIVEPKEVYPIFSKVLLEDSSVTINRPQLMELQMFEFALMAIPTLLEQKPRKKILECLMYTFAMKGEAKPIHGKIEEKSFEMLGVNSPSETPSAAEMAFFEEKFTTKLKVDLA
jgi:hypothetical protein